MRVPALLALGGCLSLTGCLEPATGTTGGPDENPGAGEPSGPGSPTPPSEESPAPEAPPGGPSLPVGREPAGPAGECDVAQLSKPHTYGAKVKTLLTGLPLTSAELETLNAQPDDFSTMVEGWMSTPEYRASLLTFLQTAFQQNQPDLEAMRLMLRVENTNWGRFPSGEFAFDLLQQNFRESFARTALKIVESGRPWTDVLTTRTFEMTTAMLFLHAYLEQRYIADDNERRSLPMPEVDTFVIHRRQSDTPPPSESLDPSSPNFLHFYVRGFENLCLPPDQDTFEVDASSFFTRDPYYVLLWTIMGRPLRVVNRPAREANGGGMVCVSANARLQPLLERSDFSDWRPVEFQPVDAGRETVRFYHLARLRAARTLPVHSERVGFFTHLGFLTTWPTNEDNESRVTLNQTLIAALGSSFDGQTVTDFSPPNLDAEHSAPGTACFGCHQTLDPMREFFTHSYSVYYGRQDDAATISALSPEFVFGGVRERGRGVGDLATILSQHPDFPSAWIQKLCHWANGAECPERNSDFEAIETSFAADMDFEKMLRDLLSSSLVTHAECVDGGTGQTRSINRRDVFCSQLSHRLEVPNICGENLVPDALSELQEAMRNGLTSVPKDAFARGEPEPLIITQTGLFTRSSREAVCAIVAENAFGAFEGLGATDAVTKMVSRVIGLPDGDPRRPGALEILNEHVREARAEGASDRLALQSALVMACMAPGMAGIGF